jgi:glucose-6-phosphate 1-epimerase
MADIETLRRQFGGDDLNFVYAGDGLVKAVITNKAATAEIFLLGATVTHWQPVGQSRPVLFTSAESHFKPDKAIRGGIPVCWPWFGPHPTDPRQPQHGLVRNKPWKLANMQTIDPTRTRLRFEIETDAAAAALTVTVGPTLHVALRTRNRGASPMRLEEALHTYLHVGDSRQVEIAGVENREYIDKVAGGARKTQDAGPVRFTGETDRVYLDTESPCVLRDAALGRTITVAKGGSRSTVIWNPWVDKAASLSDFGDDEWTKMCCIEAANAADNAIELPKNGEHEIWAEISVT